MTATQGWFIVAELGAVALAALLRIIGQRG